jgi:hypothetical protein
MEDFESFNTGDVVASLPGGVTVSAQKRSAGVLVAGEAMIFDSASPTGGVRMDVMVMRAFVRVPARKLHSRSFAFLSLRLTLCDCSLQDFDLGTPHESFPGGVGVGVAGAMGSLWENSIAHGKVLIISEDGDSSDPDDNRKGGVLTFDFSEPQPIDSIGLLDNVSTELVCMSGCMADRYASPSEMNQSSLKFFCPCLTGETHQVHGHHIEWGQAKDR